MVPGRNLTAPENSTAIMVLSWLDFSSYPQTYPAITCAGALFAGIAC
jgi:hypothetical protein